MNESTNYIAYPPPRQVRLKPSIMPVALELALRRRQRMKKLVFQNARRKGLLSTK
jgi:hypothetical protein